MGNSSEQTPPFIEGASMSGNLPKPDAKLQRIVSLEQLLQALPAETPQRMKDLIRAQLTNADMRLIKETLPNSSIVQIEAIQQYLEESPETVFPGTYHLIESAIKNLKLTTK